MSDRPCGSANVASTHNASSTGGRTNQQTTSTSGTAEQQHGGQLNHSLVTQLECPVCFEIIMPPILQCSSGHLLCSNCQKKVTKCPVCRVNLTNIRNLAVEQMASNFNFPCKHAWNGCPESLSYADKKNHEADCDFRQYSCPYLTEKCIWQGSLRGVYQHVRSAHPNVCTIEGHDVIFLATNINTDGAFDWTMMQSCHGHNFLFSLEKIHLGYGCYKYYAGCRLIGSIRDSAKFLYSMSLNATNRMIKWQFTPGSIRENYVELNLDKHFIVINESAINKFIEDDDLALNVVIRLADEAEENI